MPALQIYPLDTHEESSDEPFWAPALIEAQATFDLSVSIPFTQLTYWKFFNLL